jgi:predicted PurR-regulated permease PerM
VDVDEPPVLEHRLAGGSALVRWGVRAWLLVGVLLAAAAVAWLLGQLSGLVVPLVIAAVLGALLAPVVDRLERHRVPRIGGATAVLLGLGAVLAGSVWLVVAGVVEQAPQISAQLRAGFDSLSGWLETRGIDIAAGSLDDQAGGVADVALDGIPGMLPGVFSSTASFLIGAVIAVFLLYYVLTDWDALAGWVGGHLGVSGEVGTQVVTDTVDSLRRYFWSLTLSAVVTAVLIGGAALVLGVPLVLTIALITLTTSYIPYLGAIFSGAFATLIALGSNGVETALVLLAVILVVQNVIQTVVLARLSSTALRLHPIVTIGSTIVGAAFAGVLGATLGTPATAAALLVHRRLSAGGSAPVAEAVGRALDNDGG